jgi:glycosyltransferase 2 family protein
MPEADKKLVARFGRWVAWAVGLGVLLYVAGAVWGGLDEVGGQLSSFSWGIYVPVLLLTLVNYFGRFLKWHFLLRSLNVEIGFLDNLAIYIAGLAMVISPGKVGEMLKPWLVSQRTGVSLATTTPALVAERLTDGIAMLILAAIGVSTYAADSIVYVVVPSVLIVLGLLVLMSRTLSLAILGLLGRLPVIRKVAHRLEEMYSALRVCLSPMALLWTIALSLVAWWAECVGYLLVFEGLGEKVSLDACTFLYAFATIAGGAMPGGIGVADGALIGGAVEILGVSEPISVASALLIRVATLWFGVVLGAIALLWFDRLLGGVDLEQE